MADIKVFISSVQKEFAHERRLLCDYIRTDGLLGRFFVPFIFEDMPASEVSAQKAYLTQADDFRTIIYRMEKVTEHPLKVSNPTEKVSDLDSKSNQVRLTA